MESDTLWRRAMQGAAFAVGAACVLYFMTHPGFAIRWLLWMAFASGAIWVFVRLNTPKPS